MQGNGHRKAEGPTFPIMFREDMDQMSGGKPVIGAKCHPAVQPVAFYGDGWLNIACGLFGCHQPIFAARIPTREQYYRIWPEEVPPTSGSLPEPA